MAFCIENGQQPAVMFNSLAKDILMSSLPVASIRPSNLGLYTVEPCITDPHTIEITSLQIMFEGHFPI